MKFLVGMKVPFCLKFNRCPIKISCLDLLFPQSQELITNSRLSERNFQREKAKQFCRHTLPQMQNCYFRNIFFVHKLSEILQFLFRKRSFWNANEYFVFLFLPRLICKYSIFIGWNLFVYLCICAFVFYIILLISIIWSDLCSIPFGRLEFDLLSCWVWPKSIWRQHWWDEHDQISWFLVTWFFLKKLLQI